MALHMQEAMKLVNQYIGVTGGYLGDFSYRTHGEFYPEFCGLEISLESFEGTTREKFLSILRGSTPGVQAKIIRGTLARFPVEHPNRPDTRTWDLFNELTFIADRLEKVLTVGSVPNFSREAVTAALLEAEKAQAEGNPIGAVDRMHTVIHGYLISVCNQLDFVHNKEDTISKLFKVIRRNHPKILKENGNPNMEKLFNSFSNILDALSPIRNNSSLAHPNSELVGEAEAILVSNTIRTILQYLDSKI